MKFNRLLIVCLCAISYQLNANNNDYLDSKKTHEETLWEITKFEIPKRPDVIPGIEISGCVSVQYKINSHGEPYEIRLVKSNAFTEFENNALLAMKNWKWRPTLNNINKQEILSIKYFAYGSSKMLRNLCFS